MQVAGGKVGGGELAAGVSRSLTDQAPLPLGCARVTVMATPARVQGRGGSRPRKVALRAAPAASRTVTPANRRQDFTVTASGAKPGRHEYAASLLAQGRSRQSGHRYPKPNGLLRPPLCSATSCAWAADPDLTVAHRPGDAAARLKL